MKTITEKRIPAVQRTQNRQGIAAAVAVATAVLSLFMHNVGYSADALVGDTGAGPMILTSDLIATQEVRSNLVVATWAIVATSPITSVTVNGKDETVEPADVVQIRKEIPLKVAQTVITVAAIDSTGGRQEKSYRIVNPTLPLVEPLIISMPATKIEQTSAARKKEEQVEKKIKENFGESDFTNWAFDSAMAASLRTRGGFLPASFTEIYKTQARAGRYPVWIEARGTMWTGGYQFRAVFKDLPNQYAGQKAFWGLGPLQYNNLVDDLTAQGYEQVFREVYVPNDPVIVWRIQTVWVKKK